MPKSEPQGCLTAILNLFGIRLAAGSGRPEQLPYRRRDDFLTAAELSFYRVLMLGLDGSHLVCPKVNLADIFFVARPNENQSYRNKIDRKHVDFLLLDPTTMKPIIGVELDDASHARRDRQDRDEFVDQVFEAAGLPLLRVRAAASYSPQNIADLVRQDTLVVINPRRVAVVFDKLARRGAVIPVDLIEQVVEGTMKSKLQAWLAAPASPFYVMHIAGIWHGEGVSDD